MARVKGALNARKRHKKVLKLARGYRGARSKQYRVAKQSVMKAMAFAFAGRKQTKREYRSLWITRINAAARLNGLSYSKFMYGLKLANVDMNRKMLAELAGTRVIFALPDTVEQAGFSKAATAVLHAEKLKRLHWQSRYPLSEGLRRTIDILERG